MKIHIVQPNETLSSIAAQHGVDLDLVLNSNPFIKSDMELAVGQKIKIPTGGVRVQAASQTVKKEERSTLPKWWQEEGEKQDHTIESQTVEVASQPSAEATPEQQYGSYPALDPAVYPAIDPSTYFDAQQSSIETTPVQGGYAYPYAQSAIMANPIPYAPTPYPMAPATFWYDPFMTIIASNRIPIPPRRKFTYGFENGFLQMDDWQEDWQNRGDEQDN